MDLEKFSRKLTIMNLCPVCNSSAHLVENISAEKITNEISHALPGLRASYQVPIDYSIARCDSCELVFADPMIPGEDAFYSWVCSSHLYYPHERWEWTPLLQILREKGYTRVLDVGCGSGLFLKMLKYHGLDGAGVDSNQQSVDICKKNGLNASCVGIETLEASVVGSYEVLTLFHVLEHLSDPVDAIQKLRKLLVPGGVIAVSVPYSPMSFETDWRDPLNRPPHHLTRWNESSLRALAERVGLVPQIFVQPSRSLISRTLSTLQVLHGLSPVKGNVPLIKALYQVLRLVRYPADSLRILYHQRQRDICNSGSKGDAVLVLLSERST
jgi:2-polyprenyl-3-methyl-5-hydroxy-6-metoxy-1,4-benzoquinol methylase